MRNEIHANDLPTHTVQWTTVAVVIVSSLKAYHSCISSNILRWLLFVMTNLDCFSINNNKGLFEPLNREILLPRATATVRHRTYADQIHMSCASPLTVKYFQSHVCYLFSSFHTDLLFYFVHVRDQLIVRRSLCIDSRPPVVKELIPATDEHLLQQL